MWDVGSFLFIFVFAVADSVQEEPGTTVTTATFISPMSRPLEIFAGVIANTTRYEKNIWFWRCFCCC